MEKEGVECEREKEADVENAGLVFFVCMCRCREGLCEILNDLLYSSRAGRERRTGAELLLSPLY